jgi:transposase
VEKYHATHSPTPIANETGEFYQEFAQHLIQTARMLYVDDDFGVDLDQTAYALDSTIIDLCLSLFPWARFEKTKARIKIHTLLELHSNIPVFVHISKASLHDVYLLDQWVLEPGCFYVFDRGYLDFKRLYRFSLGAAFFVTRAKKNARFQRRYSHPIDKSTGLRFDQTIFRVGDYSSKDYPAPLRRVGFLDPQTHKRLTFLTNNFDLPAFSIAQLYKSRWRIELFFKWIKQHLRIKAFYGVSDNAVKTQIWIAISVYVLVAILKKRLALTLSLYTILQILSLSLFEKTPILEAFLKYQYNFEAPGPQKQLSLFT